MRQKVRQRIFSVCIFISVIFLYVIIPQEMHAQSPSTLWKARGLDAAEKLESLTKQLEKMKGARWNSPEAKKLRCESLMEFAYASHVNPLFESIVHKTEGKTDFFKILLNAGEEAGIFDLTYVYEGRIHTATKVMLLPKNWQVVVSMEMKNIALVVSPEFCTIAISLSDPFLYYVLDQ